MANEFIARNGVISKGNVVVTGSLTTSGSLTATGTITATTLVVQTVTSSISSITGSTNFGSLSTNTHTFTGSMYVTGGINLNSGNILTVYRADNARGLQLYTTNNECVVDSWESTSEPLMIRSNGSSGRIVFHTSGSEKMRITPAGNIGIGTTTPDATLPTGSSALINNGWSSSAAIIASRKIVEINGNNNDGGNVGLFLRQPNKTVGLDLWSDSYYGNAYIDSRWDNASGYISFRMRTANQANIVNAMTIVSNGNVLIGTQTDLGNVIKLNVNGRASFNMSSDPAAETINLTTWVAGSAAYGIFVQGDAGAYTQRAMRFFHSGAGAAVVGNISFTTTATTYTTTSDYRLKEDLQDFNGLNLISKIKTYNFKWKSENKRMYGVIAHELESIIDYAVVGKKDAEDMQSVDYSLLTPVLVKAIQEQQALITDLRTEIEELKARI